MNKLTILAAFAAISWLAVGCSSGGNYQIVAKKFPTRQQVSDIKQEDPGEVQFRDASKYGRVPHWKLQGPLPTVWGSRTVRSTTPVGQAVDARFTSAKMTESLSCYAREAGIFYAHYQRYPFDGLDTFIRQRCGVVGSSPAIANLSFQEKVAEEKIVAQDDFKDWIGELASQWDNTDYEFGVWKGEGTQGTVIYVVAIPVPMTIEPMPLAQPGAEELVFRGELRSDADDIFALTTEGEYDYRTCVANTAVKLPKFEIVCSVSPTDDAVAVSLGRGRDEDVFASYLVGPVFYLAGQPSDTFVAPGVELPTAAKAGSVSPTAPDAPNTQLGSSTNSPSVYRRPELITKSLDANNVAPDALMRRYIQRVNEVRAEAGRKPLKLEERQSNENAGLAPLIFGDRSDEDRNQGFLGALAGWEVDGRIIDGQVSSNAYNNADIDDMVVSQLATATGRRTLLDADADAAAIGSIFYEESQTVAIVATSYQFVDAEPHVERVNRFLDKLAKVRKARGASPPRKVRDLIPVADRLDKLVSSGKMTFNEAANELIQKAFDEYQSDTFIYAGGAHDPLRLTFQDRLLNMEPLRIAIMVTPFKPEGSPWYIYGVAIAYPKTDTVNVATVGGFPGTMASTE